MFYRCPHCLNPVEIDLQEDDELEEGLEREYTCLGGPAPCWRTFFLEEGKRGFTII